MDQKKNTEIVNCSVKTNCLLCCKEKHTLRFWFWKHKLCHSKVLSVKHKYSQINVNIFGILFSWHWDIFISTGLLVIYWDMYNYGVGHFRLFVSSWVVHIVLAVAPHALYKRTLIRSQWPCQKLSPIPCLKIIANRQNISLVMSPLVFHFVRL